MAEHSCRPGSHVLASDRGAILIQVAVAMVVLIAFTSFVADYGLMWVGRRQAQNAADAGALAGAVAMALDNDDRSPTGPAKTAAYNFAIANYVAGEAPNVIDPSTGDATDVKFYTEDPPAFPPECADNSCIRVDAYRNQERSNPLPVWFSQLVGVTDQGVRATAIAQVAVANASECLKPWAIPDKWIDWNDMEGVTETPPEWTADDEYHTKEEKGPGAGTPLTPPDYYRKQGTDGPTDTGTGFTLALDYGREVRLKFQQGAGEALAPGLFLPVVLPNVDESCDVGGSCYQTNIETCNGVAIGVGETLTVEPGAKVGPTAHGMEDLIALDPNAYWNGETVVDSCAQDDPACGPISPRIVSVPVFDTDEWYNNPDRGSGRTVQLTIVNILGFFLDRMVGNDVVGYFMKMPGLTKSGAGSVAPDASFLKTIQLVR